MLVRSSNQIVAIVGGAGRSPGAIRRVRSLSAAIEQFGERGNLATKPGKTIANYNLVDAIATIYNRVSCEIVALNAWGGTAKTAVAEAAYTFAGNLLQLPDVNISLVAVKSSDGATTYVAGTDYAVDADKGQILRLSGAIAVNASVKIAYSIPNYATIDWPAAIATMPAADFYVVVGVEKTVPIVTAMVAIAIENNGFAIYSQPGATAAATVPLSNSRNAIAVYPKRTIASGEEGAAPHLAGILAAVDYWNNPVGAAVAGNSAPAVNLSATDIEVLAGKNINYLDDRLRTAETTDGTPIALARIDSRIQAICRPIADKYIFKDLNSPHIEGCGQAFRDRLNQEPIESGLPDSVVNFDAAASNLDLKKLAYTVARSADETGKITSITITLR